MKSIDDKLNKLNEEINRREKLRIHLTHLDHIILQKQHEKEVLAAILAKEEKEYIDLQNVHLYTIFSSILGTKKRQLEKEKQDYLHALLMYRGAEEVCNNLLQEKKVLLKSLNGLHVVVREFDRLIAQKEKLLKEAEDYPEELVFASERIASFEIQIKEIDAAISKGNTAKRQLHKIIMNLRLIEQWGFKGRNLTNQGMQRKTKSAQKDIYSANNLLQKYEDQLHDISVHFSVNFNKQIKNLEAFLDRFVDSLITDWVVNNKIENSIHLVNSMMDNITKINGSLEFQKAKVKKYLEEDIDLKGHLILEFINKNKS